MPYTYILSMALVIFIVILALIVFQYKKHKRKKIIKNIDKSYHTILDGYEYIDREIRNKKEIVMAAEWLMDNLYLIEKEYKHIKNNMPEDYYNNLPILKSGFFKGYPRIYYIAYKMVIDADGKINEKTITAFIENYQKQNILTSGELWALPIMLRVALIQNIGNITSEMVSAQSEKHKADIMGDKIINAVNTGTIDSEFSSIKKEDISFSIHFTERLIKLLRDNGIDNKGIYDWIDKNLDVLETSTDKIIKTEHQKQVHFQLSMGNCINSIREVEALNWRECFEKFSYVEEILRRDPSGIYEEMDFESRDYYRHNIEKLAKYMKLPESFVAKKCIECATEAEELPQREYEKHVGYYIIDQGITCLKKEIKYKEKGVRIFSMPFKAHKAGFFIFANIFGTLLLMAAIIGLSIASDKSIVIWKYIVTAFAIIIPCSEIVNSILNYSINHLVSPKFIPKVEFKTGIPDNLKTLVVIPTILSDVNRASELIDALETYFLANNEKNLYFAILADFKDSKNEREPEDDAINNAALEKIKNLNSKYKKEDIFYLFNRRRTYNPKQGIWLGWERKRGKLMELNELLMGKKDTDYNVISGDIRKLQQIKYIITLDSDTKLPRDAAKRLIGAMSHVLNRAHFNDEKSKVSRGYGIMQPRISIDTVSANKTFYSKIFSGETGIDTYSMAVSDIYQDLFMEGIYTGKGIYDAEAFQKVLEGKIKDNSVLSHDLLEGSYAKCALVSDIELIDGYPSNFYSNSKRLCRWVRGDWQLLPYIFGKSKLDLLSRWKMIDNLRRSILAPSIIILFVISLTIVPDGIEKWLSLTFVALICPWLFDVSEAVASPMRGVSLSGRFDSNKQVAEQIILIYSFLPFTAFLMVEAILKTLYRVIISKKNLLQWQTAEAVESSSNKKLMNYIAYMWWGTAIAVLIQLLAFRRSISLGFLMFPSCIIWFVSPFTAYFLSKNKKRSLSRISGNDRDLLRRLARKTYAYFEDFVNEEENWLAPDNYQINPHNGVAHRTSPTNMGMGITSNIVAYDLGYINITELLDRTDKIISSMETLEKYAGHFYNWYDTKTKAPLIPKYVSTVDSGNLVGYLWLASSCIDNYLNEPVIKTNNILGLKDTLRLANEEIESKLSIKSYYNSFISEIDTINSDAIEWKNLLRNMWSQCSKIEKNKKGIYLHWNCKLKQAVEKSVGEIQSFFPWADMVAERGDMLSDKGLAIKNLSGVTAFSKLTDEIDKIIANISISSDAYGDDTEWVNKLTSLLLESKVEIQKKLDFAKKLKNRINKMAEETDFKIVFDGKKQLFSIGYDVEKDTIGTCYYDLLASESRQASFIAIAKGDVPQSHWFKLGRAMTIIGRNKGLVSWSGTMFEYFMPLLIMKNYPDTLLSETYKNVVEGQKKYAKQRKLSLWGISESAFYSFDVGFNYQYKAFGVPGIGLKRGLVEELVISPYSTVLALQQDLNGSISNIKNGIKEGLEGIYGLFEAVDYTKDRLGSGKTKEIVQCFMVHHQGMSLMSFDNVLNNFVLQNRFHSIPKVKATELLLQERIPKNIVYDREQVFLASNRTEDRTNFIVRTYKDPNTDIPETHLLANGNYSLMISNSGSGYSKKDGMMVYRWTEDVTTDDIGLFFYIKDLASEKVWSSAYEPCKSKGDSYEVIFALDKAEFKRRDEDTETCTEIAVSNEDNSEVRKISLKNNSKEAKTLEITSYAEITLAPLNADEVHPAFSNLFIRTEFVEEPMCILANRRPRAKNQKKPWVMQTMVVEGKDLGNTQYETRRVNFIGRGNDLTHPQAMAGKTELKNSAGDVLDPIISIRKRIKIEPSEKCTVYFISSVCESREEAISMAEKYQDTQNVKRIFELAWNQSQVELNYLGIKPSQANLYQLMASKILFINAMVPERADYIKNVMKGQSALWAYGISGDLPIVLLIVRNETDTGLIKQMLNAHEYWAMKGLIVDFVILNMDGNSYLQDMHNTINDLIISGHARDKQNKSGGVYLYNNTTMSKEDIDLLMAISRLVVDSDKGLLISQIKSSIKIQDNVQKLSPLKTGYDYKDNNYINYDYKEDKFKYYNGYGGFDTDRNEYVIRLRDYNNTPSAWINVISNRNFGFHVSEAGNAYSWCGNSRENKITPWSNDYITDKFGEALYIRDEDTGEIWSASAKPIRDSGEYIIRHGFGYSVFEHCTNGISSEMTMFVPMDKNVKICAIHFKNLSPIRRKLSLTYYSQLVMGVVPRHTNMHIVTEIDQNNKFIYARNPYSENFGKLIAYLKIIGGENESFTGNRKEFIGRGGALECPSALLKEKLTNNAGAGLDPCMAENCKFDLKSGETNTLYVIFGEEGNLADIVDTINKYSSSYSIMKELDNTKDYWRDILSKIKVKTPDPSMDIMMNGWLMYQAISCRLWAKTAFYQSGGAYGFRDQLQDVMSLSFLKPEMTRKQIIVSASRQFLEGDVQHWWHPVVNSGIRTRFSDDLLWLPYVTSDYIKNTGDYSILEEEVSFLEDEPLKEGEDERYNISKKSEKTGTIYEHCIKAIEKGLKFGVHNIPLMGSGDWNDGMSTVGNGGKGESIWLGWFIYSILEDFKVICGKKQDDYRRQRYAELSDFVKENLEENAWDGRWYRRAYFDDGTPLGSSENDECSIDSLSQSWAVISRAADAKRARTAMNSLEKYLVREDSGLVLLLTPPFNNSKLEPGYIKGYVPGVRENGGQYTHAATWVILAMTKLGKGNKAWDLFHMINPINHTKTKEQCETYIVEPYVMAADVYATEPYIGRGGWTWYTGTAGWMYRVGLEGILGLHLINDKGFTIKPCIPEDWKEYEMSYIHEKASYDIRVCRGEENSIKIDGKLIENELVPFKEFGRHFVDVTIK